MRAKDRMFPTPHRGHRTLRTALGAVAALALGGCLDLNPVKDACSVTIAPAVVSIPLNGQQALVGSAFDCDGATIRNKRVAWSSANATIATVTAEGIVIGIGIGSTTVSAVADGKTATAQVTVIPEAITAVQVSPGTLTLRRTQTRQFTAVARNAAGGLITGRAFRWSSSNSSFAAVDQSGIVTALAPGSVTITAESDQTTGSAQLTVTEIPIGACALSPTSRSLTVGQQLQPTVTLRDTANSPLSAQGRTLNWQSSNEVVATVSGTGVITAARAGTARITALVPDNQEVNCAIDVTVVLPRIVAVEITPRTGEVRLGIPRQYAATLRDSVGQPITGRVVTWSTPTPAVLSLSQSGVATGLALGTARIIATAEGVADTVQTQVTKVPISTIAVSPAQSTIFVGTTQQFTATITDSTGAVVTDRPVVWTSSSPTIASVAAGGLATGAAPGTATITATSDGGRTGSAALSVQLVPAASIEAPGSFEVTLGGNTARSFAIRVLDAAGNQLFNRTVVVISSVPGVATAAANANGTQVTVSPLLQGTTVMTLQVLNAANQAEGRPSQVTVTVRP